MKIISAENSKPAYYPQRLYTDAAMALAATSDIDRIKEIAGEMLDVWPESSLLATMRCSILRSFA